jgi:hypothetical protein
MKKRFRLFSLITEDKDWLRAFYTTESEYAPLEFIQAFVFLILYFFFFGYFTNILLFFYAEEDQPVYMARLHGFLGLLRKRTKPIDFKCNLLKWFSDNGCDLKCDLPRIDRIVVFN